MGSILSLFIVLTQVSFGWSLDTSIALVPWGTRQEPEELINSLRTVVVQVEALAIAVIAVVVNMRLYGSVIR